jgi:molecular chaperone HscB
MNASPRSNPFDILGVEPRFDLDAADLHRRFVAASAKVHPDRSTDPEEQLALARRSAALNQAYRTLTDPESRAAALLELVGSDASADHRELPHGLLEQMLDIREQMDEALGDEDQSRLNELSQWAQAERAAYLDRIAHLFSDALAAAPPRPDALHDIRRQLNALRYIERMIEQLDPDYDVQGELS